MSTQPMNSGPRDWDADTYDRVSDPQFEWGVEVLNRLDLNGDESAIDAGAGSGRVTARLAERLPAGRVLAIDGSPSMIEKARENLGERADYAVMDLAELEVPDQVDLVFSTATFHWIADHDNLFRRIHAALKPGGRLHAQCGGAGNVASLAAAIASVGARPEYASHLENMPAMWNFAGAEETAERLRNAGFEQSKVWLEPKPVTPAEPREYMRSANLGPLLTRLPTALQDPFVDAVSAEMEKPLTLDYVRLNMTARKPA
ncbi:MAG: methyltransferase domain-containing protein [Solirubrobacterales bacterium]